MTNLEVLKVARWRISAPEAWTKGLHARDSIGAYVANARDSRAVCWCSGGAIDAETEDVEQRLAVRAMVLRAAGSDDVMHRWNDAHTHAEVLRAFDCAIAIEEAQLAA